jgi:hypothetical protein
MSLVSFVFKNDARIISEAGQYVALSKIVDTPVMVVHLFLALTVSIGWRLLFPCFIGLLILSLWVWQYLIFWYIHEYIVI